VCQRLAPRAREPDLSSTGTPDRASSVIVKTMGMTAKPIIKPTTSELRCSKLAPVTCGHHRRKSPNTRRSHTGPRYHAPEATRTKMGTKARNSEPGLIQVRYPIGSVLQTLPNRKAAAGRHTSMSKNEG